MSEIDIEFLKLTTDICYITGGHYDDSLDGYGEEGEYTFVTKSGMDIDLNMNEREITYPIELTRAEIYSIEKIAIEHGLKLCFNSHEQELKEFNEFIENYDENE